MKQSLNSQIMVSLELSVIEDVVKIIGNSVHCRFSHDEVSAVKNKIISVAREAMDAEQYKHNELGEKISVKE